MLHLFKWADVTSSVQSFKSKKWIAFGFSDLTPQASPRREAKLQNDIVLVFIFVKKPRTSFPLRKRHYRELSPRLQHGISPIYPILCGHLSEKENVKIVNITNNSRAVTLGWKTTLQKLQAIIRNERTVRGVAWFCLLIQWNLDTLGECSSVRLIQGVRLIQFSIDKVSWGVKCHSNEQWKRLEYSQGLWRYFFIKVDQLIIVS